MLCAADLRVQVAGFADMQVSLQRRVAGENVLKTNFGTGGAQLIQGVEGIGSEMTTDNSNFHGL